MKKILNIFSKHKFTAHLVALLLMSLAPILMYFGALDQVKFLILIGLFMMIIANIIALATK